MIGFLICGPPGVGKSTNIKSIVTKVTTLSDILILDPDKRSEKDHEERSKNTLEEVYTTIEKKNNFVYIATCGGIKIITNILKTMKESNYKTIVCIIYTDEKTASDRILLREQKTPPEVIKDLHSFFSKKASRYMSMKNIDELFLYNNQKEFTLLLQKKEKKITCFNKDLTFYFDISSYCRNHRS